jgi:hypothetical protein
LPSRSIFLKSSWPFGPEAVAPEAPADVPVASPEPSSLAAIAFLGIDAAVKFAFFLAPIPAFRGRGWNIAPGTLFAAASTA